MYTFLFLILLANTEAIPEAIAAVPLSLKLPARYPVTPAANVFALVVLGALYFFVSTNFQLPVGSGATRT